MTVVQVSRLLQSGPFRFGFVGTVGVLLALVLGFAIGNLGYPLTLIFFALFVSLGLYPVVLRLERLGMSRAIAVLIVLAVFLLLVVLLLWLIIPVVVEQFIELTRYLPFGVDAVEQQAWFDALDSSTGGVLFGLIESLQQAAADPAVWLAISGGALRVGAGVVNATFGVIFVVALTLYFVAGLEGMKRALYSLVPASSRHRFVEIAEEIFLSVGKYLSGMFLLAAMNSAFTFLLLTVLGVRYAAILAALALPIAFIPLIGSVLSTIIITTVSLFTSPQTGLTVLLVMLVYMQVEAYVFTPRIVGRAIRIPGALVLIGAMVGATLLGLLGALVACPVTASLLLIAKKVVVPAQNAR